MLSIRLFVFSLLYFNILYNIQNGNPTFISPVKIPIQLSANFGELRIDHYHSGLDIKTQGVTGKEVVATAQGYIYRISVSPGGFGKALYVRHPSGFSTVYAHLERFTAEIDEYIISQQYEKKSFQVTLFPSREKFPVNQGDLIAWSGNSGSSAGPHLHYEIRKSESEMPVNPLLFEFGTEDNIKPVIEKLVIYPVSENTVINNNNTTKRITVSGGQGNYFIPSDNEIIISGKAGFGIKSFDLINGSSNKCAVYSTELEIDSISVFKYVMDGFSFNETRFINSHIDYETYMKENTFIERTFLLPNDKLSVYRNVVNRGIFNFNDMRIHNVRITVTDAHNNKATLSFQVRSMAKDQVTAAKSPDKNAIVMPFHRNNKFVADNISVSIPSGVLYDTLFFSYNRSTPASDMLSALHSVHNKFTPVHKPYILSIKPDYIPEGKETKMMIVQYGDDQKRTAINSRWSEEYLTADVSSFGNFYIGLDTISPVITPNGLASDANLSGKREMKIKITDDFSGIKSYEPLIDSKWALFEYDPKNEILIYKFDDKRITKGTRHSLSLKVTDNKDNSSHFNCFFIW